MSVKLVKADGTQYVFPVTFRVEGWPSESAIPALTVEGKDGAIVDDADVVEWERSITVSGILYADMAADLQAAYDALAAFVNSQPREMRLYADETDTRFFWVRKQTLGHRFVQRSGRTLAEMSIVFRASDPFHYADETVVSQVVPKDGTFIVSNPGKAVSLPSSLIIRGAPGGTTNPKLTNQTAGRHLQYTGDLTASDVLVCYPPDLRVEKNGVGVLASICQDFLFFGFPLVPGDNTLKFEDAVAGAHSITVEVRFSAKFF